MKERVSLRIVLGRVSPADRRRHRSVECGAGLHDVSRQANRALWRRQEHEALRSLALDADINRDPARLTADDMDMPGPHARQGRQAALRRRDERRPLALERHDVSLFDLERPARVLHGQIAKAVEVNRANRKLLPRGRHGREQKGRDRGFHWFSIQHSTLSIVYSLLA